MCLKAEAPAGGAVLAGGGEEKELDTSAKLSQDLQRLKERAFD